MSTSIQCQPIPPDISHNRFFRGLARSIHCNYSTVQQVQEVYTGQTRPDRLRLSPYFHLGKYHKRRRGQPVDWGTSYTRLQVPWCTPANRRQVQLNTSPLSHRLQLHKLQCVNLEDHMTQGCHYQKEYGHSVHRWRQHTTQHHCCSEQSPYTPLLLPECT